MRIPLSVLGELQRATVLGRIDFSVLKGWRTPEEWALSTGASRAHGVDCRQPTAS
jgi:hypothetical protein